MKYQLLLRDIYKYTERAQLTNELESLRQATRVMQIVPKSANDMMDVGRLQGFDVSRFRSRKYSISSVTRISIDASVLQLSLYYRVKSLHKENY